jgi:hypothetical protein
MGENPLSYNAQSTRTVFLELSGTEDYHMGGWCKCKPLSYHNIPLRRKEHGIVLLSVNTRKIIVKLP